MKECENCNKDHDGTFASGRFCCVECSRAFSTKSKRNEINLKVSNSLKGKLPGHRGNFDKDKWKKSVTETWLRKREKIKEELEFAQWPEQLRKEHIFAEQNYCCSKCKLDKWLNEMIPLELEHRDGNRQNNSRENLELLCPNCHALTDTWRGRNKNTKSAYVSDEVFLEALQSHENIRQALISLGLSPKGGNYIRAKRLLNK